MKNKPSLSKKKPSKSYYKRKAECKHEFVQYISSPNLILSPSFFCKWCLRLKYIFKNEAINENDLYPKI